MEKINLSANVETDIEKILTNIKNSPICKSFIEELKIEDEEIKNHFELFNYLMKVNEHCLLCKGMNECYQSTKGYQYIIARDIVGDLTDGLCICHFFKEYYLRKSHIEMTTFHEEDLLDGKQQNYFLENMNQLEMNFVNRIILILKGEKINGAFLQLKDSKSRIKMIKALSYRLLLNNHMTIVKFSDFLLALKSDFNKNNDANTFENALKSDILLIDGIGSESITNWSRDEVLLSLLDNRLQREKTTILCSEFSLEELRKIYKINGRDDVKANQIVNKINEIMN